MPPPSHTLPPLPSLSPRRQIEAGADMMQIFEAMGEFISKDSFYKFALPCMQKIATVFV
jgi:uroporphyrinogen-III decarboxylase